MHVCKYMCHYIVHCTITKYLFITIIVVKLFVEQVLWMFDVINLVSTYTKCR